jgi:hypothetical protein
LAHSRRPLVIRYYDRAGNPIIDTLAWAKKFEDVAYKRVAETTLPDGKWISTVWLGLNYQYGAGPPLIFETMVFPGRDDMGDLDCERYSTEAEAMAGHNAMVTKWLNPPVSGGVPRGA